MVSMASPSLTNAVSTALAALAVLLQVLVVLIALLGLISLVSPAARRLLVEVRDTLLGNELWIAWGIALAATLGSLYFSELAKFVPCHLCWYQRIAMYPMAVILLVAALRRDVRAGVQYAFVFPIVGILDRDLPHLPGGESERSARRMQGRRNHLCDEVDRQVQLHHDSRPLAHGVLGHPHPAADGLVPAERWDPGRA